ncbi:MAG TPA: hypothetical protein ENJ01_04175 [Gammaproteobacteria bacterium]|nr:hypothetical protein [Gammaproteobacteria bacterium]
MTRKLPHSFFRLPATRAALAGLCLLLFATTIPAAPSPAPAAAPVADAAVDAGLEEIRALARIGAPALALHVLDTRQPSVSEASEAWMAWERERVRILAAQGDWVALARRMAAVPASLPASFRRWARTREAEALVEQHQGRQARHLLRELIWGGVPDDNAETLPEWRRLIIRSYVNEGQMDDARTAVQRFRQDYGEGELDDILLRARIELLSGRADVAATLLAARSNEPEVGVLQLLAQLRGNLRPPRKVMQAALRHLRGEWVNVGLATQLWAIVAESAQRIGDRATAARALENVIIHEGREPLMPGLARFEPDTLWNAYLDYATWVGNRSHFLIGEDSQWLAAAKKAHGKTPVRARSLYALVILRGVREESRLAAAAGFLATLEKQPGRARLLGELFGHSRHFQDLAAIPLPVRHALVDVELAASRIERASALMATIAEPPAGADRFPWQLRRARILVLGNQAPAGAAALAALLKEEKDLSPDKVDHLMQVIFDLQAVGEHEHAITLFETVYARVDDEKLRRELLYWMADSRKAQKAYAEAARLYLRSAMLPDPKAGDPWAQTARYQAATALARAGLKNDARDLFEHLLRTTKDPARRAVLNRELQHLWLE